MREDDWTLLSIEPTTDLAAIKKAYALKLRVTRPDDDAEAYQALRGTYERALTWAKHSLQVGADPDGAPEVSSRAAGPQSDSPPLDRPAFDQVPALQAASDTMPAQEDPVPSEDSSSDAQVPEPPVSIIGMVDALDLKWRRQGDTALMAEWPRVCQELGALPLSRVTEASERFAEWVVRRPDLPDRFVGLMQHHFAWLDDFRSLRLFAPALVEALEDRLVRPLDDPELRAMAEPLEQLHGALHSWRTTFAAHLLGLLSLPWLQHALGGTPAGVLRRLGLSLGAQAGLRELVVRLQGIRLALLALAFVGISMGFGQGFGQAFGSLALWILMCFASLALGLVAGAILNGGLTFIGPVERFSLPMMAWRRHRNALWIGIGLLLTMAFMIEMEVGAQAMMRMPIPATVSAPTPSGEGPTIEWVVMCVCICAGVLSAWPAAAQHGFLCAAIVPLAAYVFAGFLPRFLDARVGYLLGAAWVLFAAAVHERRVVVPAPVAWFLRPVLNNLALSDRWGYMVALMPLGAVLACEVLLGLQPRGDRMALVWFLSILAVAWLHGRGETWALQRLRQSK